MSFLVFLLLSFFPTSPIPSSFSPPLLLPALHEAHKRLQWLQCPPSILCTAASPESQVSPGDSGTDPCGLCLVCHHYPLSLTHTHTDSDSSSSVRNMRTLCSIHTRVHTYKTEFITKNQIEPCHYCIIHAGFWVYIIVIAAHVAHIPFRIGSLLHCGLILQSVPILSVLSGPTLFLSIVFLHSYSSSCHVFPSLHSSLFCSLPSLPPHTYHQERCLQWCRVHPGRIPDRASLCPLQRCSSPLTTWQPWEERQRTGTHPL